MKLRSILTLLLLVVFTTAAFAQQPKTGRRTVIVRDGKVVTDDFRELVDVMPFEHLFGKRAYLGVSLIDLTDELREHYGAAKNAGILVGSVEENGPAAKAGVRVGDIVLSVDGKEVESSSDLRKALADKKEGDSVRVEVLRGRSRQTLIAAVAEREGPRAFRVDEMDRLREIPEMRAARLTALPNCVELQSKLKELETKMKELEKKLQK